MSAQPPERTRLFKEEDVQHILRRYRVPGENAEHVRYLSYESNEPVTLKAEMFESLYKLRLLWLTNVVIEGNFPEAYFLDLIWLRWRRCSSKWLPPGRNLEKLVIMEVTNSQISYLWHERAQDYATIRPQKLKVLILSGCTSLETLPSTISSTQLQILDLSNCNSLRSLPNSVGNLRSLVSLNMEGSGISSLPEDFGKLSSLQKLNLSRCKHLSKLPASFGNLSQLETLEIHHNPKLTELPDSFGGLKALLYLDAGYCQLSEDGLPAGIFELISLKIIHLESNGFHLLPDVLQKLASGLWELHLDGCEKLSVLPAIPPSLQMLFARNCPQLKTILDVSNSCHVTELHGLEALQGLLELKLVGCENISTEILESCLGRLKSLESVFIGGPGVSPEKLQCLYDSIKSISFNKQCLLTTPDMITSDWLEVEAAGRNGEEIKCAVEDKVKYCAGYIVCSLSLGEAVFPRNDKCKRLSYTLQRDGSLGKCEVIHPIKMNGGETDMLEVRVVRALEEDSDFEWLQMGDRVTVNALTSDYDNWKACFKFLMYEPPVEAICSHVENNHPLSMISFHGV
ncbi:hypothetical protein KI387_010802 [Taxus chinensis]|uniref:Disease resistance R13L4/SHOC-2-like LRR domain-containing protein n=1 Tax=Taxus chinensis TaxID=29808 RepID=A0AA38FN70_TAXCH|nr:hypothetical protein KI387_010802 [Taxus chinensis]